MRARLLVGKGSMGSIPAMIRNDRQAFCYRADVGGSEQGVVSLLDHDWVFRHGLPPEAVMAIVRDGADPDNLTPADVQENGPFRRLLSRVIFETIDQCGEIRRQAQTQGSGYLAPSCLSRSVATGLG